MADTYCTPEQVAAQVGITDANDDLLLAGACDAASRQVDAWCGRRFWQDTAVTTREFYPCGSVVDLLEQPTGAPQVEISTATGLIVKTDTGDNGGYATTLTIDTDFLLQPRNAIADGRAFDRVSLLNSVFPSSSYRRATVQITAKFGWATVPEEVVRATIIQATQLYKAKDAVFGAAALGEQGSMYVRAALNPMARALLGHLQLAPVG